MLQVIKIDPVAAIFFEPFQCKQVRMFLRDEAADKVADPAQFLKGDPWMDGHDNLHAGGSRGLRDRQ
ncbi:hypothetical protein D3C81_2283850 [compost metagenome]